MMTTGAINLGQRLALVTSFVCPLVENSLATPLFVIWSDIIHDDYGGLSWHDEIQ